MLQELVYTAATINADGRSQQRRLERSSGAIGGGAR